MTTEQQIKNVIAYIGTHFEEKLTLDQLSKIACLSKYHFHRLFTVYTGLSLHQYVRWLRLKRAAHQLLVYKDKSIIEIAIHAGFESHEAFTRAFKLSCGLSPSEFRLHPYWHVWEMPSHGVHHQGKFEMNIEIRTLKEKRLAVLQHYGVPEQLGQSVHQLLSWAASRMINVRPQEAFGIAYDDPQNTPAEEFRFDLALTVPAQIKLEGMIIEKFLPAGRYAVASHKGSRENIGDTVYSMYRDWLPSSGETLGEQPCVFCYHNFEHETPETELITECRLLLR